MLTFLPLYCTPFFPGCKEKFYKFSKIFQYFFDGAENFGEFLPKTEEYRPQKLPKGALPPQDPQKQTGGIA